MYNFFSLKYDRTFSKLQIISLTESLSQAGSLHLWAVIQDSNHWEWTHINAGLNNTSFDFVIWVSDSFSDLVWHVKYMQYRCPRTRSSAESFYLRETEKIT